MREMLLIHHIQQLAADVENNRGIYLTVAPIRQGDDIDESN